MSVRDKSEKPLPFFNSFILLFLPFLVWIFCFRGFLFNQLSLVSDAIAYYEHFKFFTDALEQGIYPMWDLTRHHGTPVEFFLRRIGSFNPFISLIIILKKTGLSFRFAYLFFLGFYYFIGMIGFYLTANRIFQDKKIAYIAYLLLMFSSLGTRLFDSYLILTVTPLMWFFYFLISFAVSPKRCSLLGITFTLMILFTTYIPFYFINIVFSLLICFVLYYGKEFIYLFRQMIHFLKKNKIFAAICLICFICSLIPGVLFFAEGWEGELIIPERRSMAFSEEQAVREGHAIEVDLKTVESWGMLEDIVYSTAFPDFRNFKFAIVYIPIFSFLVLFLGLPFRINKRLLLLATWGFVLFLTSSTHAPIHRFLYHHIFYFKYFRNLHFFLWFILIPIFILFICEQLRIICEQRQSLFKNRWLGILYVFLIHGGFLYYEFTKGFAIPTTYIVILLSFFGFLLIQFKVLYKGGILYVIFSLAIIIQPLEVYHYLNRNSVKAGFYGYDRPYLNIPTTSKSKFLRTLKERKEKRRQEKDSAYGHTFSMYVGLKWFKELRTNISFDVFEDYHLGRFWLYDRLEKTKNNILNFEWIEKTLRNQNNIAFVPDNYEGFMHSDLALPPKNAQMAFTDDKQIEVQNYSYNYVTLKSKLKNKKFLVYNDAYHSDWQAFIDGQKVPLWRANIAFKGLWVPSGEHIIHFRYGAIWQYILNWTLLVLFYVMFVVLIITHIQYYKIKS